MISLEMLFCPGVFPLARFLRLMSKTSLVSLFAFCELLLHLFLFVWCHGYICTTQ